ncbi:MAG: hypothetical protein ACFFDF_01960 [Candidatus Odinarchaeota archaeon]
MAILEIGINFGLKSLVELKYYKDSDKVLDPKIRARFLSGVQSYISEVYDDKMNVISFSKFQFVCYYKLFHFADKKASGPQQLIVFAIIEKGTDNYFVTQHLKEIISQFLKTYYLDEIMAQDLDYFKPFEEKINNILGDLRFKMEDRFKRLFP